MISPHTTTPAGVLLGKRFKPLYCLCFEDPAVGIKPWEGILGPGEMENDVKKNSSDSANKAEEND